MANNTLYLVHRPSRIAVLLGKRYLSTAWGSDDSNMRDYFLAINSWIEENGSDLSYEELANDFVLALEDNSNAIQCAREYGWDRKYKGFPILEFKPKSEQ